MRFFSCLGFQGHLENIIFADVTEDDLRLYSDQCFLNLFRLSQLLLEYLLNVQDTLATSLEVRTIVDARTEYCQATDWSLELNPP